MVWVRAYGKAVKTAPYTAARKVGVEKNTGRVQVVPEGGGATSEVSATDLMPRNPPGSRPDNCQLLHLNEACVLENVAVRYMASEIYTWTSHVLTAVNPYEPLPLYSDQIASQLPALAPRDLPPHAFSVAELAVRNVVRGSQAVIVSGESGAGKTFNMAHVMAYLTRRARNGGSADSGLGVRLGTLLLQSNPVLEAFGNAQTVRNHNSSRFGKFVKVVFDASGTKMATMTLKTYLLVKVRVVFPSAAERTYHVFYALLAGASRRDRARWGLRSQEEHALTKGASDQSVFSEAAAEEGSESKYIHLGDALTSLTVRSEEQSDLLGLVAAILHLRDVSFVPLDDKEGGCRAVGSAALAHAVKLLGAPGIALGLVQRVVLAGREAEPITVPLTPVQASSSRDALCKTVYVAIFNHICRRFNEAAATIGAQIHAAEQAAKKSGSTSSTPSAPRRIHEDEVTYGTNYAATSSASPLDDGPFVGLLDMFGFEVFEVNSFEQVSASRWAALRRSRAQHLASPLTRVPSHKSSETLVCALSFASTSPTSGCRAISSSASSPRRRRCTAWKACRGPRTSSTTTIADASPSSRTTYSSCSMRHAVCRIPPNPPSSCASQRPAAATPSSLQRDVND